MTFILDHKPVDIFLCDECFKTIVTDEFDDNELYGNHGRVYRMLRTTKCPICKTILSKDISGFAKKEGK